jgi:glycolate dehydrogenase FAD-binding subunit
MAAVFASPTCRGCEHAPPDAPPSTPRKGKVFSPILPPPPGKLGVGGRGASRMTTQVLKPQSEVEIADIVRGARAPFEIMAHGTKREYGRPVDADTILDVSALSGIVSYEPEELVLSARAATPMTEIQAALGERNQMLAFEPADWGPLFGAPAGKASLGGTVATNASGSRRVKTGAVRDSVIGCRFINGRGEAIKAGGRVIKNVTGFDIAKLMAGAFGTLGVMTEITVRVIPRPERVAAVALYCSPQDGLRALRDAARLPIDATGLAYFPAAIMKRFDAPCPDEGASLIRVEGSGPAADEKIGVLTRWIEGRERAWLEGDIAALLFDAAGDGAALADADANIWRLCVPATDAPAALAASGTTDWYADWAGGLLWLSLPATGEIAARLRAITARFGGHATLTRAPEEARRTLAVFEPELPARAGLTGSVKAAFDPNRLFNPGRMFEGV